MPLATGSGAEGCGVIGAEVIVGTPLATLLTLFVVPGVYVLLARFTRPAGAVAQELNKLEQDHAGSAATAVQDQQIN